ncbi:ABC transporter permease [Salinirubellus salinus]|uniref:ABC transporter permease n=2 Tax=Salinirubellus salinus TaxID=1364945 RepID=A0A9E7R787_9EURY|nr:ABC transporter permease [Salinirubellus salinus]UWM56857.1 ABC transporter permease [Salinirubellus salinus]
MDRRRAIGVTVGAAVFVALVLLGLLAPDTIAGDILDIVLTESAWGAALRLSAPIALAALGGIYAEKSGVINIGLEGLLIISAFTAVWITDVVATGTDLGGLSVLFGFFAGVVASALLSLVFAVVCIEFRADQIIAGLAIWLVALGLAPFASQLFYGGPNTSSVGTVPTLPDVLGFLPRGSELPQWVNPPALGVGPLDTLLDVVLFVLTRPLLFAADVLLSSSLSVYLMFAMVVLSWYGLFRTRFGRWVRASGENPRALDTAGVDVSRVRYAAVLVSGVLSGMGGAALSLGLGQFTGNGPTMVNGKGFIAIVAYLFGNYNPVGAFLSTFLFAGLDALQLTLQTRGTGIPDSLVRIIPFVTVIVVLALVGKTRIPEAAGEHYESGEE